MAKPNLRDDNNFPELRAVLDHQNAIEAASRRVRNLETVITEREQSLQTILGGMPATEQLRRDRGNLQAAIALREITEADAKKREAEISGQEKQYAAQAASIDAVAERERQALDGLRRQLVEVRSNLQSLKDEAPNVLHAFVRAEAERVCVDYVNACLKVKEAYLQLLALNELLPSNRNLLSPSTHEILLPTFRLPQCDGLGHPNVAWGSVIYTGQPWLRGQQDLDAMQSETARIRALGVELD